MLSTLFLLIGMFVFAVGLWLAPSIWLALASGFFLLLSLDGRRGRLRAWVALTWIIGNIVLNLIVTVILAKLT
jgi:hypothetical protein